MLKFSSPHGDFSFSMARYTLAVDRRGARGFRPLTGISLFLFCLVEFSVVHKARFSSPHGDFSFSILFPLHAHFVSCEVFVPSRGFLFFYVVDESGKNTPTLFSSPHGDFSFSIQYIISNSQFYSCFRPLTGISLFL